MGETPVPILMKEIGEALELDNEGNEKEAYKKYVGCTYKIATNLIMAIRNAGGDVTFDGKTSRQVKLAQQCIDRMVDLMKTIDSGSSKSLDMPSPATTPTTAQNLSQPTTSPVMWGRPGQSQPPSSISASSSASYVESISTSQKSPSHAVGSVNESGHLGFPVPSLPDIYDPYSFKKSRSLTPTERAQRQNQSLMAAYKARMNRLNRSNFNAFSYSLTIQRKMAENLAIAQAQEEELARKMQSRNQRLEEEAAKRFSQAAPVGMSKEEQEQRHVYKRILEYENDAKWLCKWREKLETSPEDPILISQLVQEVLRCSDHPITELLRRYQFRIYEKLYPLVNKHAEVDEITVPLPKQLWPSKEDVEEFLKSKSRGPLSSSNEGYEQRNMNSLNTLCEDERHDTDGSPGMPTECGKDAGDSSEVEQGDGDENSLCDSHSNTNWRDPLGVQTKLTATGVSPGQSKKGLNGYVGEDRTNIPAHDQEAKVDNKATESLSGDRGKTSDDQSTGPSEEISSGKESKALDDSVFYKENSSPNVETAVSRAKKDLQVAQDKGDKLVFQLSREQKQAHVLMRQVTRDYEKYEEDNFDDLYDDEEEEDDKMSFLQSQNENSRFEYATSLHPRATQVSMDNDVSVYHSLPADIGQDTNRNLAPKIFSKISAEAYSRHLKAIADDIHNFLDKLLVMMTIAYEPLNTPVGREQCAVSLEEPFFKSVWKFLLRLYRVVNYRQESMLAYVMTVQRDATPELMKVNRKFWLPGDGSSGKPYQRAVTELLRVREHYTVLSKIDCVVKVCRLICECVDEYYAAESNKRSGSNSPSLGADDLLPVLGYVVVQTACPQLVSECDAMAEFINEGFMIGEEGYCLTTLRTALTFLTSTMVRPLSPS